ncbi:hypothetical protein ES703_14898 [subsurface metagenome]
MFRKLIYLVSFVLVLGLVGDVQAATVGWEGGLDHLWSTPANWSGNTLPTSADDAIIDLLPGPTIVNEGAVASKVDVGSGGIGALTVDGGTLAVTGGVTFKLDGGIMLGRKEGQSGTLNMNSGTITVDGELTVGHKGPGTLNMTGGTITILGSGMFRIAHYYRSTGHVDLDGGIITANGFQMRKEPGAVSTMDVEGGTLIINGDKLSLIQGYIDNGWITAYDGNGTLQMDYDVTNEGATTLTALHKFNPTPASGDTVVPGVVELSWTLPDPCVPGQPVPVDVYFTDDRSKLEEFTDPAAIQVVSKQNVTSVVVQTQLKTRYYWAVDTYIGDPNDPILGSIFSFFADNMPPRVDAGADVVTWLADGVRTKNLDATVTDDEATTVQWTVVSEPDVGAAVIETATAEDTSITLAALGQYVLQLEAFDGEFTGSDTVTINVCNDSCEAAQSLPDYEPVPGDLNGDCIVDDLDLAILQENWLKDDSLTEEWVLLVD